MSELPLMSIDLFATVAEAVGAPLPSRPIDSVSFLEHVVDADAEPEPRGYYQYYHRGQLQAVRKGRFKLVFAHRYRTLSGRAGGKDGMPVRYEHVDCEQALYDLDADIGERVDVSQEYPEVLAELTALANAARADLGDATTGATGSGLREPGRVAKDE